MAVHAPITGAPLRAPTIPHPAKPPLMPAAQRILLRYAKHDRASLEAFLSLAIELLDVLDGDPDLEDDDPAGGNVEDEAQQWEVEPLSRAMC